MQSFYFGRHTGSYSTPYNLSHLFFQLGEDYLPILVLIPTVMLFARLAKFCHTFVKILEWNCGNFGLHASVVLTRNSTNPHPHHHLSYLGVNETVDGAQKSVKPV